MEAMKEIIETDEGFDAFKKSPDGGFTARSCPRKGELSYEKRFWKWIQETPKWTKIFSQWEDVDHLKCFVHWARQRGCFDSFCEYFGKEVMFGEKSTMPDLTCVAAMLHEIQMMMKETFTLV